MTPVSHFFFTAVALQNVLISESGSPHCSSYSSLCLLSLIEFKTFLHHGFVCLIRLIPRTRREGVEELNAWQPEGGLVPVGGGGAVGALRHCPGMFGRFRL